MAYKGMNIIKRKTYERKCGGRLERLKEPLDMLGICPRVKRKERKKV
jgi:hypothetical protein